MERVQSDCSKLSALGARQTPDVSLALSSSRLGGVKRDPQHERILQPTASSAQTGLASTQGWDISNASTQRGSRALKIPGRNMYGSLSSAIGPSKDGLHVNYTVSEDATESNLLNKLSRMLAILDESVLVHLVVITNMQVYKGEPAYQTAHEATPTKQGAMPDISHISQGSSNSPGLGYPLVAGQVADALRSAFIARQQISEINARFDSWVNSYRGDLTKRQMWYAITSWHPIIDEHRIRFEFDRGVCFGPNGQKQPFSRSDYLNIVSTALYGKSAFSGNSDIIHVLCGSIGNSVKAADILKSVSSCKDHVKLESVIQSIDKERIGFIDGFAVFKYMHSVGGW